MATERLATTPNGRPTVDVLKKAYMEACAPTPFDEKRGDPVLAELVHMRIAVISFSDYWSAKFEDYGENFNGNPAGYLAQNIFRAAEELDGDEILSKVAAELAGNFAEDMFEGEIDTPELSGTEIVSQELSSLARFLSKFRQEMEGGSIPLSPRARKISDSWIAFSHVLAASDPTQHDAILGEVVSQYGETDEWTEREMEMWEGMMGGFNSWNRDHAMMQDIAKIYAAHFPQIVVSRLKNPVQLYTWNRAEAPEQEVV